MKMYNPTTQCPKCSHMQFKVKWEPPLTKDGNDFMYVTCMICGYAGRMLPSDASINVCNPPVLKLLTEKDNICGNE